MNELRHDQLLGHSVIIAPERAARPMELEDDPSGPKKTSCDFCAGHEAATTGETYAIREAGTQADAPGWRVLVIPNKFPAVAADASRSESNGSFALHSSEAALGIHEVIVESPKHVTLAGDLDDSAWTDILAAYRERLLQLSKAPGINH